MSYHSADGREFVGLRNVRLGKRQVICDAKNGRRVIIEIEDRSAGDDVIQDALREGIGQKHVLGGVIAALNSRKIQISVAD